jgi:hypothetical protein
MKIYAMRDSKGEVHEDTALCEVHYFQPNYCENIEAAVREELPEDPPTPGTWHEVRHSDLYCVKWRCGNDGTTRLPGRTPGDYRLDKEFHVLIDGVDREIVCLVWQSFCDSTADDAVRYANGRFLAASTEMEKALSSVLALAQSRASHWAWAAVESHCRRALAAAYSIEPNEVVPMRSSDSTSAR